MTENYIKNIVIVNDFSFINGGISKVAIDQALGFSSRGYQVYYFTSVGPVSSKLLEKSNIEVICLDQYDILNDPNRIRAIFQGVWNTKSYREIRKLLLNLNANETIIHIHGWSKALSSSIFRAIMKLDFKYVITNHDYFIACPNGGFFNYPQNKICTLRGLSFSCFLSNCDSRNFFQKEWRFLRGVFQNWFANTPKKIKNAIFLSDLSSSVLMPYYPKNTQVFRVNNPINIQKTDRILAENNSNYVYVGRMSPEKGVDILAKAANDLNEKVIFIGDGRSHTTLKSFYPSIKVSGWLSTDQLLNQYQNARALIFPSIWYEAQPLVIYEAAALGIPSIISDCNAAREAVVDGVTGLWFKSGDFNDLKNKISLLKDAHLVKKFSINAYTKYWEAPLTLDKHVDNLLKVYQQC